jgi:DNA-binding NarL/FixJ family response regulator
VTRLRVLVADDHALVRDGLAALLRREDDLDVVAECGDGDQALARIEALEPTVAVVDIAMPGMTGIEVARKVRDLGLRTAVVLVSARDEPAFVRGAVSAGASGYVLKEAATRELLQAVRAAAGGDVYLSPRVAATALSSVREASSREAPALTPRERDVLRLLARGLSSKEIAAELSISATTVAGHRQAIMDKLDIRHVPGLVKYAIKHQLASLDE